MSRTYRKRKESFEEHYKYWFANDWFGDEYNKTMMRVRYYTTSNKWYSWRLPKEFRNYVNRKRRRKDKREIWKAVNWYDYPEQCSDWNCKDNESWGYF